MTKQEYRQYQRNFEAFMNYEGITNLTGEGETYFSWRACNCCGTRLGGQRQQAKGFNPRTREVHEYEVCMDCVWYAEYGTLDDETMLSIEDEQ